MNQTINTAIPKYNQVSRSLCYILFVTASLFPMVAAMPDDEASRFVGACVLPAVEKMSTALDGKETPYLHVIRSLVAVLNRAWPTETADENVSAGVDRSRLPKEDLLRAFPVADVSCCCDSPCPESGDSLPPKIVHPFSAEPPTPTPTRKP